MNIILHEAVLLALLLLVCPLVFAQNIQFERIPNELGLSQNYISALCQDRAGFIWVGTKDGLNRFDGYNFKTFIYDPFDSLSISNNFIYSLLEDSEGRLWVGTEKGLNLYNPQTASFTRVNFPASADFQTPLADMTIFCITEDRDKNIWLGTINNGVIKMAFANSNREVATAQVSVYPPTVLYPDETGVNLVFRLNADTEGNIWVSYYRHITLIKWDATKNAHTATDLDWEDILDEKWKPRKVTDYPYKPRDVNFDPNTFSLFSGNDKTLWIRTVEGIGRWNPASGRFDFEPLDFDRSDYFNSPLVGTAHISLEDSRGRLWIIGNFNMAVYNPATHQVEYSMKTIGPNTGPIDLPVGVKCLLEDNASNIWAGTLGLGLFKYSTINNRFRRKSWNVGATDHSIRTLCQTADGTVWLSNGIQVLRWNRQQEKKPQVVGLNNPWAGNSSDKMIGTFYAFCEDRQGNLWVGGVQSVLTKWVLKNGQITDYSFYKVGPDGEDIFDIYEDTTGQVWLITNKRFGRFDESSKTFQGKPYLDDPKLNQGLTGTPVIHQSADGTFWLGTNEGLKHYDPVQETFTSYVNDPKDRNSLSNNSIKTICPDPRYPEKVLWIGTAGGGLNRFEIADQTFTHFSKEDGLPDNVIYGILTDEEGWLWMSTNQGIARFDPTSHICLTYTKQDGLQDNEFNSCSYFKSPSGELFFGGIYGFNSFFPGDIQNSTFKPPVVITDLLLANKKVRFGMPGSPLEKPVDQTSNLVLSYQDKIFSFEFAALDFTAPDRNEYAYMLENFDNDWQYINNQRNATFTNISPGTYTFRVKASNCDGVWNEEGTSLEITILPPWWETWWAWLSYIFILGGATFWFYKFQLNRRLEQEEAKKIREMDALKSRLYTNITHEFRTPLTVIMGMTNELNDLIQQSSAGVADKGKFTKGFSLIRNNSQNLLRLINQLLDLSKLESGMLKLEMTQADIIPYLEYLTESFSSRAVEDGIRLFFYTEVKSLVMDFDEIKIQHIVYNLLSNALKFTEPGGKVVLHTQQQTEAGQPYFQLKVSDTGIGISEENLTHIFDRFYQVDNTVTRRGEGTGIGLALTKELSELMQGRIQVESRLGEGTVFTLLLPIRNMAVAEAINVKPTDILQVSEPETVSSSLDTEESSAGNPLLLVVEDNPDVTYYIRQLLAKEYQIETAADGQTGIDKAFELIPDIIISDVMMPRKDGFEVTETLKNDTRTSHIPIILLTAKATEEDRIAGLKSGADAYLQKPFNKEELLVRLEKLVALRKMLLERYAQVSLQLPSGSLLIKGEPTLDDIFLQKILQLIEDKIDQSDLGIEDMCRVVGLGRTQLFRKINALTGESPIRYIQKIRLKKAKELLLTSELNVSEIAYEVGFSDPNYFARAFSKEFGIPPSAVRK
ncbi:MAG: two-component regulator propeller domain-containing protein [Bacteroidia bacterium]